MADRNKHIVPLSVITAFSLVVMGRQLMEPGVYSCIREDTICYLNWTRQFADSLASGVVYPRWMPDSHGGYGSPTFIFYSPLPVFITAVIKLASGDIVFAATAVKFAGLILSGATMYVFARGLWGSKAGVYAALAYIALPFRAYDAYFLGVHSARLAFALFPLVMHYAGMAAQERRAGRETALLAMSYASLCLTHLMSAYMMTPALVAFGMVRAGRGGALTALSRTASGLALGALVSAVHILPAAMERGLVHFNMVVDDATYRYNNNFLFYLAGQKSPANPFFYGYAGMTVVSTALAGIAAYLSSIRHKSERRAESAFFIALAAASILLMSDLSGAVWELLPGMKILQFPSRWAAVMLFAAACLFGCGIARVGPADAPWTPVRIMAAAALAATLAWAAYYDTDIIARGCRFTADDVAALPGDMDVPAYAPSSVSLEWLNGLEGMPEGPKVKALDPSPPVSVNISVWKPQERGFEVEAGRNATLAVRTFYYPGWRSFVDGTEAAIGVQERTGAMLIRVPAGRHEVRMTFRDTPDRLSGWAISGLSLLAAALLYRRGPGLSAPVCRTRHLR